MSYHSDLDARRRGELFGQPTLGPAIVLMTSEFVVIADDDPRGEILGGPPARYAEFFERYLDGLGCIFREYLRFDLQHGLI
jgi:hypothetical protein